MSFWENLSSAISSVFANKIRTFLTMIGIIIGVSSVITITSLGKGLENTVEANLTDSLNNKAVQIMPNFWGNNVTKRNNFNLSDIKNIAKHPNVNKVSGYESYNVTVYLKEPNKEEKKQLIGFEPSFAQMQKNFAEVKYGRVFTEQENNVKSKVCLISEKTAEAVFGRVDVVGEDIKLYINNKDYIFKVIGVTDKKNIDVVGDIVSIPLNTLLEIYNTDDMYMLYLELNSMENLEKSKRELIRIISANHKTTDDKYVVQANMEVIGQVEKTIKLFTIFIGFVGALSLLVGGIGVMNIMLVTVTERTREIGIRKSLGATEKDIKTQFLIESMFICLIGGIIGIITGYIASVIIGEILKDYFTKVTGMTTLPPVLSLPVTVGATVVSIIVGVFFGVYPAGKAAKLDPIECLRYE